MLANLRAIWKPERYHGHGRSAGYFEGWYYKFVDAAEAQVHAVIPGVFLGQGGRDSHAFVQTLDGRTGASHYHRYRLDEFWAAPNEFDLRIGPNRFRADGLELALTSPAAAWRGQLRFGQPQPWPVSAFSPGIMGWYALVPFMECYHGVVSLDHPVAGTLELDGQTVSFDGGRGYIEKDWGQAFPQAWIWMQTNHFAEPGTCLTASVARIPWLGSAFRGFIVGLWRGQRLHRFATYNGAHLEDLHLTDQRVVWRLRNATHRLELLAGRSAGGLLRAPMRQAMLARVLESLTAQITVRLTELSSGRVAWEDTGRHAGLEVGGDVALILNR